MFKTLIIKLGINVILGWLKSLWDRFVLIQKSREEGRQEVRNELAKREAEVDERIERLNNSDVDLTSGFKRMRDRADKHYGNNLSKD